MSSDHSDRQFQPASSARGQHQQAISHQQRMVLTARETEAFLAALENPPVPNERLRSALRQYRKSMRRNDLIAEL